MRRVTVLFLFVLPFSLLLSACQSQMDFSGESEHWAAELKVVNQTEEYQEKTFELRYKGDDVSSVGDIIYKVETNAGAFGGSNLTLPENGILTVQANDSPLGSSAKVMETVEIDVTIEWNGETEQFFLNSQ